MSGNDEETYLRHLDAGLFTLQLIDYIITELCLCPMESIRGRVITILGHRGESLSSVYEVMKGYVEGLGDEQNKTEKERLHSLLTQLQTLLK